MSVATDALSPALTDLLTQLGKAFTYGGTTFRGISNPREESEPLGRAYEVGAQWDTELIVDPGVTAFSSGLPSKGDVILQTSDSRKFTVASVSYDDGDHIACLKCHKSKA